MKKIKFIIPVLLLCVIICMLFSGCRPSEVTSQTSEPMKSEQETVIVYKLPSPPHYKEISDKETVSKIRAAVNAAVKERIYEDIPKGGWIVRMVFSDSTSVSVLGEEINMNGKLYKNGDSGLEDTLIEIYNNSNAEEKEYSFTLN